MAQDNYKGFNLFNDIEDAVLRTRNRAVVLSNIAADHSKNKLISAKGASLILGYFNEVPVEERKDVTAQFIKQMYERGFKIVI